MTDPQPNFSLGTVEQLKSMVGKTFIYQGNHVKIVNFERYAGGNLEILTDSKTLSCKLEDLREFLRDFLPVEEDAPVYKFKKFKSAEADPSESESNPIVINEIPKATEVEKAAARLDISEDARDTIKSLRDILMENINNVRRDRNYIPQANTVNNSINTLINLVKLEIEITKEHKKG